MQHALGFANEAIACFATIGATPDSVRLGCPLTADDDVSAWAWDLMAARSGFDIDDACLPILINPHGDDSPEVYRTTASIDWDDGVWRTQGYTRRLTRDA